MLELLQKVPVSETKRRDFQVVVDYTKPFGEVILQVCKKSVNFVECYENSSRDIAKRSSVNVMISPIETEGCKNLKEVFAGMVKGNRSPLTLHDAVALYTQHRNAFVGDADLSPFDSLLIVCGDTKVNSPLLHGMGRECVVGVEIVKPKYSSFVEDIQVIVDYVQTDMRPRKQWRLYSASEIK